MTLKEETIQRTKDYVREHAAQLESYEAAAEQEDIAKAYQAGAECAIETMIEKACKWLADNAYTYFVDETKYGMGCSFDSKSMIEDFKQAMEE